MELIKRIKDAEAEAKNTIEQAKAQAVELAAKRLCISSGSISASPDALITAIINVTTPMYPQISFKFKACLLQEVHVRHDSIFCSREAYIKA